MAVLVTLIVAIPAGAAIAGIGDIAEEAMTEEAALAKLDRLHQLPETLEYMPPAPWYEGELESEGRGYEFDEVETNELISSTPAPMATTGTQKILSLAIEFTDVGHSSSNSIPTLQNRLTGSNSMKSYFDEVSYDNITVDGTAYGWYEASESMAYYGAPEGGGSDSRSFYKLVREAVLAANPTVDFSKYDTDGDRIIDGIALVHAGPDEATGGGSDAIWSKQSVYPGTLRVDGVYVGYYFTVSEQSPVGVYVHEFGHMLGLPDLYDTDYSSTGVGVWDLMGSGAWNNWGRTPGQLSAWSKTYLGWVTPTTISNFVEGYEIRYVSGYPDVIKLPTTTSQEYFLLENRYRAGYDRYLPGDGLLIWHIDNSVVQQNLYYNRVNNNENRKGVDLEEASGTQDLDVRGYNDGDNNDLWKNRLTGWTPDSTPNSRLYDGTDTKITVFNISAGGTIMTIDIDFGGDSFAVFLDTMTSNMNAAPGETMVYNITVGTRSSVGDTVRLSLTGTHVSWGTLEARYVTLNLGPKAIYKVQVKVTPPAGTPKDVEGQVILKARSDTSGLIGELETLTLVRQVHLLTVTPEIQTVTVVPGIPKHLDITITNVGNGLENITLALDSNRSYWGSLNPNRVSINVLGNTQVRVTFSVPLEELADEVEDFELILFSEAFTVGEGGSDVTLVPVKQIPITMVVEEVVSLRWGNIPTESLLPGGTIGYEFLLFNEGNGDAPVTVSYQAPDGWTLEFLDGDNQTIPAFQTITVKANVTAPMGVPAGSFITIELSAAKGFEFFYSTIGLDIAQR